MQRQLSEKRLGAAFSAGQSNLGRDSERRLQELRGDQLWHCISDADLETDRAERIPVLEGMGQLTAKTEDLISVAKSDLADLGQANVPSHPPK